MKTQIINSIKIIILGALLSGAATFAANWTTPTSSAPAGNIAAPINVTTGSQLKAGSLATGPLEVFGPALFYGNVNILGSAVENCSNGVDDNGNGLVDNADPACGQNQSGFLDGVSKKLSLGNLFKINVAYAGNCNPTTSNSCSNAYCNPNVGSYSCSPDQTQCNTCVFTPAGPPSTATAENWNTQGACTDGIDNDQDGDVDMNDEECPMTFNFSSNKTSVTNPGDPAVLSWDVLNVKNCTASGGWSGAKGANTNDPNTVFTSQEFYSETVHPTSNPTVYTLKCTNLGPVSMIKSKSITISSLPPNVASGSNLYVSGKTCIGSDISSSDTDSCSPLIPSSSAAIVPSELLEVNGGTARIYQLQGSGTVNLCSASDGRLVRC
jgi:hypothetical protein